MDKFLNPKQAAAYLGISRSLLYKMIEARQIAHYRPGLNQSRGKILLAVKDLDAFMEDFRVEAFPRNTSRR